MNLKLVSMVLLCFLSLMCQSASSEEDPILRKLEVAEASFQEDLKELRDYAKKSLSKLEDVARRAGDKPLVDQIKEEGIRFEETGEIPFSLPDSVTQRYTASRKKIDAAYAAAIKDYLRAKKDYESTDTERRFREFRKSQEPYESALVKRAIVGTWKLKNGDYTAEWVIRKDGTISAVNQIYRGRSEVNTQGNWVTQLDENRVLLTWKDGGQGKVELPLVGRSATAGPVGKANGSFTISKVK